ncbi:MAG: type II toxin-antitoxin system VapC family toxin [Acidimicrobiales bacterium]
MSQRLLLDTHPLLWWLSAEAIAGEAGDAIADPSSVVAVSAASIWEITIKRQIGKLRFEGSPADEVRAAGFEHLPITAAHAELAGDLPLHHRDPFDRMLVAQAQAEGLTLVSGDPAFDLYDVRLLRC